MTVLLSLGWFLSSSRLFFVDHEDILFVRIRPHCRSLIPRIAAASRTFNSPRTTLAHSLIRSRSRLVINISPSIQARYPSPSKEDISIVLPQLYDFS